MYWKCHVDVVKKVHSRLYCLRNLRSFDSSEEILRMFYTAPISTALTLAVLQLLE